MIILHDLVQAYSCVLIRPSMTLVLDYVPNGSLVLMVNSPTLQTPTSVWCQLFQHFNFLSLFRIFHQMSAV